MYVWQGFLPTNLENYKRFVQNSNSICSGLIALMGLYLNKSRSTIRLSLEISVISEMISFKVLRNIGVQRRDERGTVPPK